MKKAGIKTTEFWVGNFVVPVVVPLVVALAHKYGIPISSEAITILVVGAVTAPLTYILGRIYHKGQIDQ